MEILERFEDGTVIALLELAKLHDHEQIREEYLGQLMEEIKKDGEIKYPLIVDRYSNVVLDGHHRFYSLKKLGCKYAPAYVVDYYSKDIKVERWFPVIKTKKEVKAVLKCLQNSGYTIEEVANEDVLKIVVEIGQACIGMIVENDESEFFIAKHPTSNFEDAIACIKKGIEIEGVRKDLDYVGDEKELEISLKSKKISMAIITPKITKEQIIETGASGNPFPPKTTRHILPERKYYPVSLSDLMEK